MKKMSDNWSLKDKERQVDTGCYFAKPRRGVTTIETYLKDDIETLRQKLIEDFESEFQYQIPLMKLIENIINKRF